MTAHTAAYTDARGASLAHARPTGLAERLLAGVGRAYQRARQRADLAELSADWLRDLGLRPGQVAAEVRKPFWVA